MLDRVYRVSCAMVLVPSTMAGMSRCSRRTMSPAPLEAPVPPDGNQPSVTLNSTIIMIPSQKLGIDTPMKAMAVAMRSNQPLRKKAERMPMGMATTRASASAASANCAVASKR
jgi:hypothetical protein